jgi:hypothetical protein
MSPRTRHQTACPLGALIGRANMGRLRAEKHACERAARCDRPRRLDPAAQRHRRLRAASPKNAGHEVSLPQSPGPPLRPTGGCDSNPILLLVYEGILTPTQKHFQRLVHKLKRLALKRGYNNNQIATSSECRIPVSINGGTVIPSRPNEELLNG